MTDADGLVRFFTVDERQAEDLPPNPNVAPTEQVYAVVAHDNRRVLVTFRWGLIPHWADDIKVGARHINARAESVDRASAFRTAFASKRCLLPADGFFEWRREPDGTKVPHLVRRADGDPMALAGLWAGWRDDADPEAGVVRSCTVITTRANEAMSRLHDRMPVVLQPEDWDAWLDRGNEDTEGLRHLLEPPPDDLLVAAPVSDAVNNARNKDPGILA